VGIGRRGLGAVVRSEHKGVWEQKAGAGEFKNRKVYLMNRIGIDRLKYGIAHDRGNLRQWPERCTLSNSSNPTGSEGKRREPIRFMAVKQPLHPITESDDVHAHMLDMPRTAYS
jgi:hypothetical protein